MLVNLKIWRSGKGQFVFALIFINLLSIRNILGLKTKLLDQHYQFRQTLQNNMKEKAIKKLRILLTVQYVRLEN